jgi:hypothetical protein
LVVAAVAAALEIQELITAAVVAAAQELTLIHQIKK